MRFLLIIQSLAFAVLAGCVLLICLFWDAPDMYPTIWFTLLGCSLIGFPILAAIGLRLARRNPYAQLLPLAVTIPAVIIVLCWRSNALQITVVDHARALNEARKEYLHKMKNVSPDFVAADGTFFTFSTDKKWKDELLYYPSQEAFSHPDMPSYQRPPWTVGHVDSDQFWVSTSDGLAFRSLEGEEGIVLKLAESKNKVGKKFREVYPRLQSASGKSYLP